MSKKKDKFYFKKFISSVESACAAAEMLKKIFRDFKQEDIEMRMNELHEIEHQADGYKHEVMDALAQAFIVPIEREDIAALINNLDEVTDKLDDVAIRLYINNVDGIRPDATGLVEVVGRCCSELLELMEDFADFRHSSKKIKKHIIRINELEEEADQIYVHIMRNLHVNEKDALQVIAWREIYTYLEKCADACEHTADIVESVIMKNS